MKLTEDRISHLSLKIHDRLYLDDLVDYNDEDEALKVIKHTVGHFAAVGEAISEAVDAKIRSLKRGIAEGSPEWEVLHKKYMEEELRKKGL